MNRFIHRISDNAQINFLYLSIRKVVSARGYLLLLITFVSFAMFLMTDNVMAGGGADDNATARQLSPRQEINKNLMKVIQPVTYEHRLIVKFKDNLLVRADKQTGKIFTFAGGADISSVQELSRQHNIKFSQLINLPVDTLNYMQQRAAVVSGITQPDLAGMMIVHVVEKQNLQLIANALHNNDAVEFIYFQQLLPDAPCDDILPVTPQYFPAMQIYHGPNPGLNMQAAWSMGSARGNGIKLADCEYGYVDTHEDLCDIVLEPGQTVHPNVKSYGWDEHGTATLGEMISLDNGYGCTGLAPDTAAYFFPEWTVEEDFRRVTAIANAIASVDTGDIVLLEMQTTGAGGGYAPAEYDPAVWTVVKNGTDAGVIVVGAAGNGDQDLDSAPYNEYMSRGDSGAIIVGAGSPDIYHDKLYYSTYGSRVNVQGWGFEVFTLGYGDYAQHGGDKNQRYTAGFSGTSSASPFVTGCCLALQSLAVEQIGRRLTPLEMRDLLTTTGIPQGTGGHIGPFPDMLAAATELMSSAGMVLQVGTLTGGQYGDFNVTGATTNQNQYLIYSLAGLGSTYLKQLDVTLDLRKPKLCASGISNGSGNCSWSLWVPNAASGRTIWFQNAEFQDNSNVVEVQVN